MSKLKLSRKKTKSSRKKKKNKKRISYKKGGAALANKHLKIKEDQPIITSDWSDRVKLLTESVSIPNSVNHIDEYAFKQFVRLDNVELPNSVNKLGRGAFWGCESLKSVTISESVTVIEMFTFFRCSSLVDVTIPDSVTMIEKAAFACCESLHTITIPNSLTKIGEVNFLGCNSLKIVYYGLVDDLKAPNRFKMLNGTDRIAKVKHSLEDGDSCVVLRTWPASTIGLGNRKDARTHEFIPWYGGKIYYWDSYEDTEPYPPMEVVDATGIVSPILLHTLSGDEYVIENCWSSANANFADLAKAQHPEVLGNLDSWSVVLSNTDDNVTQVDPVDPVDIDLNNIALMLVLDEIFIQEPWLLVWKEETDSGSGTNANDNALDSRKWYKKLWNNYRKPDDYFNNSYYGYG